jgi:hypothetical protein
MLFREYICAGLSITDLMEKLPIDWLDVFVGVE